MFVSLADSVDGVFSFEQNEAESARHSGGRVDLDLDVANDAESLEIGTQRRLKIF